MLDIKIINKSTNPDPEKATDESAGFDLKAFCTMDIVIKPMERVLVPTGLFMELPAGFEAQVRPRSGLAIKHGITVLNSPGTIDSDYRGEIKVILINLSKDDFVIQNGDRIAQLVISEYTKANFVNVEFLNSSNRGAGGFGHSGI